MTQDLAFKALIHKKERKYFFLVLILALLMYTSLLFSVVGIPILCSLLLFSLFIHGIMLGGIRSNGVKLNPQQFPVVYAKVVELCSVMGIPSIPDFYVLESSGFLNAFATRFFGRNMVVLYSSIFEIVESGAEEELNFIIAHELAHIKRNHITKQMLIMPVMWIPFIGEAYSRACEYTCDRIAAYYTGNSRAAVNSLTILAIGKVLYKNLNHSEYLKQISSESGFFVWLSEKFSTHPTLPKRIQEIMLFSDDYTLEAIPHRRTAKTAAIWLLAFLLGLSIITAAGAYSLQTLKSSNIWSAITLGEGTTPLMLATTEGDLDQVSKLLKEGADPNIQDMDGWSALFWASQDNRVEIGRELLGFGANPNLTTEYGFTPLMNAATEGHVEFVELLLDFGVNLEQQNDEGWTALIWAIDYDNYETAKALLEAGANPYLKDNKNLSAFDYAKYNGDPGIVKLLEQYQSAQFKS